MTQILVTQIQEAVDYRSRTTDGVHCIQIQYGLNY